MSVSVQNQSWYTETGSTWGQQSVTESYIFIVGIVVCPFHHIDILYRRSHFYVCIVVTGAFGLLLYSEIFASFGGGHA